MSAIETMGRPEVIARPAARRRLGGTPAFAAVALGLVALYVAAGAPTPLFVVMEAAWGFPTWLLTIAFSVYAVGLLVALLIGGALSDHIGRRPVIIASLAAEVVAMTMFVLADDVAWVIVARALQGLATGAATSAFSAALVELAPANRKTLGALLSSLAPTGGLALGILVAGLAAQVAVDPVAIVFGAIGIVAIVSLVLVVFVRETVSPRPGAVASLVPRVRMPRAARAEFVAVIPVLIGAWSVASVFLGLLPTINAGVFNIHSGIVNGITGALQPGVATVLGLLIGSRLSPRRMLVIGSAALVVGPLLDISAISTGWYPLLVVGAVLGGTGFGLTFSGGIRAITPLVGAHERAEAYSALYLVAYATFGAVAIIAGQLVAPLGLLPVTVLAFTVAVTFTVIGLLAQVRLARRSLRGAVTAA